jgi:hypothetical protein
VTLPFHICTVVHNARPFLERQLEVFRELALPWTWSVCEGITPCPWAGKIEADMHNNGLSTDGTHEFLLDISKCPWGRVKLYRSDTYLTEKFQLMLADAKHQSLVVQVDADEMWSTKQLETMALMFDEQPTRTAAWFYDRFFVGPKLCLARGNGNGAGNMAYEWQRAWLWRPGCRYIRHDPPQVWGNINATGMAILADLAVPPAHFFTREETAAAGLVFNHYAFILPEQVKFKETRYGFAGALDGWKRLQEVQQLPVDIHDFLPWLGHGMVERAPEEHWWK